MQTFVYSTDSYFSYYSFATLVTAAVIVQALGTASVAVPHSNCYALDNSSHIFDFSSWIGHTFEYEGTDPDLAVRLCQDVESRAQTGFLNFGRFDKYNYFVAGSGNVSFVQEFYNGDLVNCETTYDKMGRTAQVNIKCGSCSSGGCKDARGCICNAKYETTCRATVELAIPCMERGPRIFEGFTVGFHPLSWEVVYNGLTQFGFEKAHNEFSFQTEQTRVALYMTAIASHASLVQKPNIKIFPENGLEVRLSGSGTTGSPPTTLSPTILIVDWRCEQARDTPFEVDIILPVEGYEPIQFTLTKMCEYRQDREGQSGRGWAIFGVVSCIFIVASTLFCCGGFVYKTRVENQRGIDALPGMTYLSACLETMSGGSHSYMRAEDGSSPFINQASWERPQPVFPQSTSTTKERKYGSI